MSCVASITGPTYVDDNIVTFVGKCEGWCVSPKYDKKGEVIAKGHGCEGKWLPDDLQDMQGVTVSGGGKTSSPGAPATPGTPATATAPATPGTAEVPPSSTNTLRLEAHGNVSKLGYSFQCMCDKQASGKAATCEWNHTYKEPVLEQIVLAIPHLIKFLAK